MSFRFGGVAKQGLCWPSCDTLHFKIISCFVNGYCPFQVTVYISCGVKTPVKGAVLQEVQSFFPVCVISSVQHVQRKPCSLSPLSLVQLFFAGATILFPGCAINCGIATSSAKKLSRSPLTFAEVCTLPGENQTANEDIVWREEAGGGSQHSDHGEVLKHKQLLPCVSPSIDLKNQHSEMKTVFPGFQKVVIPILVTSEQVYKCGNCAGTTQDCHGFRTGARTLERVTPSRLVATLTILITGASPSHFLSPLCMLPITRTPLGYSSDVFAFIMHNSFPVRQQWYYLHVCVCQSLSGYEKELCIKQGIALEKGDLPSQYALSLPSEKFLYDFKLIKDSVRSSCLSIFSKFVSNYTWQLQGLLQITAFVNTQG